MCLKNHEPKILRTAIFFFEKVNCNAKNITQHCLNEMILRIVIQNNLPFRIIENDPFKELATAGRPGKTVLCYKTLKG